jgi:hypothetical protein
MNKTLKILGYIFSALVSFCFLYTGASKFTGGADNEATAALFAGG